MGKFIFLLLILISGCATTTVHLYDKYLQENEFHHLSRELIGAGYKVKKRNYEFPSDVTGNTIIYYPSEKSNSEILELQAILANFGYPISDIVIAKKGNHHYTESNIGIYIISRRISHDG